MVESIEDVRKRQMKSMEKRHKELYNLRYGKDGDNKNDYDARDEWYRLPAIVKQSVKNEMADLEMQMKMMQADSDSIKKDLRDAIVNVLKYYGVEDKLPEIEENFNCHRDDTLEAIIEKLASKTSRVVDWKSKEKLHWY